MNCPNCGHPIEPGAPCCLQCFAPLEPPTFWQKIRALFQPASEPSRAANPHAIIDVKRDTVIHFTDENGQQHEYHSLDELPPDIRAEIEKLEKEGAKQRFTATSCDGQSIKYTSKQSGVTNKTDSSYKVIDEAGREQIYHSVKEMPAEIRAVWEQAQNQSSGRTVVTNKTVSLYKITDEDGHEQVYRSIEEMPPEIREAWEKADNQ